MFISATTQLIEPVCYQAFSNQIIAHSAALDLARAHTVILCSRPPSSEFCRRRRLPARETLLETLTCAL